MPQASETDTSPGRYGAVARTVVKIVESFESVLAGLAVVKIAQRARGGA